MTATVVWSPNLRLAVKSIMEMRAVSQKNLFHLQELTVVEEQAVQTQFLLKPKEENIRYHWL